MSKTALAELPAIAPQTEMWTATPVIEWLILEGWRIDSIPALIESLSLRLNDAGVPLWRLFCMVPTLHPQYTGYALKWTRGEPEVWQGFGEHGVRELPTFVNNPLKLIMVDGLAGVRRRIPGPYIPGEFTLLDEIKEQGATDYVCMPLEFTSGDRTAISFASDRLGEFSAADLTQFNDLLPVVARLIERETLRSTAQNLLDTYVGRHAGERILKGRIQRGSAESIDAAIWYADLRGFTAMSEFLARDQVIANLNGYFEAMATPVHKFGGQVLKCIGDGMLAIFPLEDGPAAKACCRAYDAALEACAAMADLNAERARRTEPPLEFGLALHLGEVSYGNIGTVDRLDFTVIGPAVNLAHRVEDLCKELDRRPLLSRAFAQACSRPSERVGRFELRGLATPQEVFAPSTGG